MKLAFIVGVGSFLGGIARYLLSTFAQGKNSTQFPYGTFIVNLIGCFIIGCLFGLLEKWQAGLEWRLFLVTGIIGGFTTFSAFSLETHHLLKSGNIGIAIAYVTASVIFGVALTFFGALLFKFNPTQIG